jgi:hypothetical protein
MARTARATRRKAEVIVVEGAGVNGLAAEEEAFENSPLFERAGGKDRIARIAVIRDEPIEEGHLGYLEASATEEDIKRRWGGGRYRLQGRTEENRMISGAYKTVHLSGEPRFTDQLALARYERLRRQELGQGQGGSAEPQVKQEVSPLQLWEMQEKRAELQRQAAREDYDRREAEREAAHKREMERLRLEAEARERERRAEDERRERDRQAAEERRQKDQEEARARDREFFAGMLQLNKEKSSGGLGNLEQLMTVLATARELFGGGAGEGGDAVTELMKNIPAILDKSQGIATQLSGGGAAAAGGVEAAKAGEGGLQITGVHAERLSAAIANLRANGIANPEGYLLRVFDQLAKAKRQQQAAAQVEEREASGAEQTAEPAASPAPARKRRPPLRVLSRQGPKRRRR